jgi:hypothetical protein
MIFEGKRSKPGLWMSGADSTKLLPPSEQRTRNSRHPMSGRSARKCSSRRHQARARKSHYKRRQRLHLSLRLQY